MSDVIDGLAGDPGPRRTGHEEAWDLLPWYLNGSLGDAERREVEEHLGACGICREEARYWRGFAELASEEGDLAVSPQEGLERLRRRAASGGEGPSRPPRERRRRLRPPAPWRATPRPVRWLVAAQAAALVVLVLTALLAAPGGAPGPAAEAPAGPGSAPFRTLSDPAGSPAPDAPLLRVVFSEQTREREMRGVLISVGGRIVAGPSPTGVYTVALSAEDDPARVLDTLRSFRQVLLAEPAAGSGRTAAGGRSEGGR